MSTEGILALRGTTQNRASVLSLGTLLGHLVNQIHPTQPTFLAGVGWDTGIWSHAWQCQELQLAWDFEVMFAYHEVLGSEPGHLYAKHVLSFMEPLSGLIMTLVLSKLGTAVEKR